MLICISTKRELVSIHLTLPGHYFLSCPDEHGKQEMEFCILNPSGAKPLSTYVLDFCTFRIRISSFAYFSIILSSSWWLINSFKWIQIYEKSFVMLTKGMYPDYVVFLVCILLLS